MIDLALDWDSDAGTADLLLDDGALETTNSLRTAILISLFTDARFVDTPGVEADHGGWWGNAYGGDVSAVTADGDERNALGSRLWLLRRSRATATTVRDARLYALDALAWLLRDGIASAITVDVEAQGTRLAMAVAIDRPGGAARARYDFTWEAS